MKHYYITFTVNVSSEDRYVTATSKYDAVANTPQQAVDSLGKEIKRIFGDEAKMSKIDVFEKIEPLKGEWEPSEEETKAIEAWNTRPDSWHTGTPTEDGDYLIKLDAKHDVCPYYVLKWKKNGWYGHYGEDYPACPQHSVLKWQKIEP